MSTPTKLRITLLFFLVFLLGFGQELTGIKTEKHQQINGTNIFMVPPPSFEASQNFKGFQDPDDPSSMIMIMEIPGPYAEVIKGFTPEMLKPNNMELVSKKEVTVSGFHGILVEINQKANGLDYSKYALVYGDEKASTLINGIYLKDEVALGTQIRQSILSTVVDRSVQSDPRAALPYDVDESAGALKFVSVMGNSMLFNRDLPPPARVRTRRR